jgi:hypothetical protein
MFSIVYLNFYLIDDDKYSYFNKKNFEKFYIKDRIKL